MPLRTGGVAAAGEVAFGLVAAPAQADSGGPSTASTARRSTAVAV
jgi:hypothetical protein